MENVETLYQKWLTSSKISEEERKTLKEMQAEEKADAFYRELEFGTAGMRGILGPGINRMNLFTVRKATIGFALYLLEKFPDAKSRGVALSHDNRFFSREFTLDSAKTLNRYGIKTYIFDSLRPTPELSFAVRFSHAVGGIMITASHNPKEYNGYKVYDENGCQLVPEKIDRLVEIISHLPSPLEIEIDEVEPFGESITYDENIDIAYRREVESIQINKDLKRDNFKIVFSPQHGTSYENAMKIFEDLGYEVYPVLSQCSHDPDFKNTASPNPEDVRAYEAAIKLAREKEADIILITDPDADRVGLGARDSTGEYRLFTGNESGSMLLDYILAERKKKGLLASNGIVYSTIVTSSYSEIIPAYYGIEAQLFLTGFKYIGDAIEQAIENKGPKFEFGYEESYGCLVKPFVRDKDALQALVMYSEMALFYKKQGKNLIQVYDDMQVRFGYHADKVYSIMFPGEAGAKKMTDLMDSLRLSPLKEIAGKKIIRVEDYLTSEAVEKGHRRPIFLPKADVYKMVLDDQSTIIIRPSGTEPKCKFYYEVVGKSSPSIKGKADSLHQELLRLLKI
ncbi:MAG: phospho-sugar mutase [Bacilli bacterium]|jgi:phosphoglucomutase|nr:phospho-sugar mutase [Bacilli bacterium]MCH4235906.1 phospho-sugar mutase [Bacilli bacterium]